MESLKIDLFANKVFVFFSPQGDVFGITGGSCPLTLRIKFIHRLK